MKKILIVEDELLIAKSYSIFLQRAGYTVLPVLNDGNVAAEKFQEGLADVIIMDVHLKNNTNGLDAARIIRKTSDVFIVFTTGNAIKEAEEQCAGISNAEVLSKPVDPAQIDRAIRKFFNNGQKA